MSDKATPLQRAEDIVDHVIGQLGHSGMARRSPRDLMIAGVAAALAGAVNERDALREGLMVALEPLEIFQAYGCPLCSGDCASANPPMTICPMLRAHEAVARIRKLLLEDKT